MGDVQYLVTLGERVLRVHVRRAGNDLFVRVDDGDERRASLSSVRGALYALVLGDRRTDLLATVAHDVARLAIAGFEYQAEVTDEAHARLASVAGGRAASHARRELRAPMPGLLVSVLVKSGDTIEASQPLAVLRAMKMENELSLPRGGTVVAVNAEAGHTVDQGQVLLVVE
jgi:biotin carboxyl carrier protein